MADENIELKVVVTQEGVKETDKAVEHFGNTTEKASEQADEFSEQVEEVNERLSGTKPEAESASKSIDESGKSANKAASFFKKLGLSLKRIFLYRTIRKVLSEIGQAAREGVSNLYGYSAALGSMDSTHAKTNLDSLATSALYVKNSIGAMLSPVIQAITPIVYQMADAFALAANAVNQLFAALTGNASFTKAVRFPTEMKSGLSGASKAAKELRRTLLGFDEINRLDMETPSGGGGGASGLDTSGMFEEAEVSKRFKRLAEILKKLKPLLVAIGVALAAWKIGKFSKTVGEFVESLGKVGAVSPKVVGGLALIAGGIALVVDGIKNMLENGANIKNFIEIFAGVGVIALGVGLAFGSTVGLVVAAVGSIAASFAWCTQYIHDRGYTWKTWFHDLWETIKVETGRAWEWIKQKISSTWNSITSSVRNGFNTMIYNIKSACNDVISAFNSWLVAPLRKLMQTVDAIFGTNFASKIRDLGYLTINAVTSVNVQSKTGGVSNKKVGMYASGGLVKSGELFIARENGMPEFVGSIGSSSAVANNDQIVSAIKQGVVEAMSQSGQNINVNVDGKSLFDIIVNRNNSQVRQTGKSPILV